MAIFPAYRTDRCGHVELWPCTRPGPRATVPRAADYVCQDGPVRTGESRHRGTRAAQGLRVLVRTYPSQAAWLTGGNRRTSRAILSDYSAAAMTSIGKTYDYLIIGSGACCSAAAYALARAGKDVLLIEK